MNDQDRERLLIEIETKLDMLLDELPTIRALGQILIRRRTATKAGVTGSTITRNKKIKKFDEVGHDRTFIEIGDVRVIQQRKKPRK